MLFGNSYSKILQKVICSQGWTTNGGRSERKMLGLEGKSILRDLTKTL